MPVKIVRGHESLAARMLAFALFCAAVANSRDALLAEQRDVLHGLRGVRVSVVTLDPLDQVGLYQRDLQTTAELSLRRSGVPVVAANPQSGLDAPELVLQLGAKPLPSEPPMAYACVYVLRLVERVRLERDPTVRTLMPVWEKIEYGYQGSQVVRSGVLDRVGFLVDAFSNDFLAANPQMLKR